jgi:membrane peptidoglycan carboxypeptidase
MTSPPNRPRGSARVPGPDPDGPGGSHGPGSYGPGSYPDRSARAGSGRHSAGDPDAGRHGHRSYDGGYEPRYGSPGRAPGGGSPGRAPVSGGGAGRATVGSASVSGPAGRASVGSASVSGASVSGAAGRASVGTARVGGPGGPGGPDGDEPTRLSRADERKLAEGGDAAVKARKKKKRRRRIIASVAILVMVLGVGTIGGTFYFTSVKLPGDLPTPQASTFLFSNGTQMARVGSSEANRKVLDPDKIPDNVKYAVVGAEDSSFYSNSGVDVRGLVRSAWNDVTGGETQGGSTITMQYAKLAENANCEGCRGATEKLKEAVVATKLSQQYSKNEILAMYLNTIFIGRASYGIAAASQAYFGVPVDKLTAEQAAVIASAIKDPSYFDPTSGNLQASKDRWAYVLGQMAKMGKYHKKIDPANYPMPLKWDPAKSGPNQGLTQPTGLVVTQVMKELAAHGISESDIDSKGYTIVTTIDPKAQHDAEQAVAEKMKGQQAGLAAALVAVRPGTGEVVAYYGGADGTGFDTAANPHPPGSSFKLYTLAAAVDSGISVKSLWNGDASEKFADRGGDGMVHNSDGEACSDAGTQDGHKVCTLYEATAMSLNTVFYAISEKIGREKILQKAKDAGINMLVPTSGGNCKAPSSIQLSKMSAKDAAQTCGIGNEVSFGQNSVSPLEHANGYATAANNGVETPEHFVAKVTSPTGQLVYQPSMTHTQAFSATTAADMDWVMQKVATRSNMKIEDGRPQANKTGTWQYQNSENQNAHAWMCGFVPKLASVVWIGHQPNDAPIYYNNEPDNEMFGSELPSDIWSAFMDAALKDLSIPSMDFPTPKFTGSTANGQFTKATPKKSSSPTPKPDPSQSDQGGHHGHSPSPTPSTSSTCNSWLGCTNPSQSGPPNGQQQNGTG